MKKEIKDLWVTALRSGKYQQGKDYLRSSDNTFCCLGVLCDILEPEAWKRIDHDEDSEYCHHGANNILPAIIELKANMNTNNGMIIIEDPATDKQLMYLTNLNDSGMTFHQIADIIDRYWERL